MTVMDHKKALMDMRSCQYARKNERYAQGYRIKDNATTFPKGYLLLKGEVVLEWKYEMTKTGKKRLVYI